MVEGTQPNGLGTRLRGAVVRNPSVPVVTAAVAAFLIAPTLETSLWGRRALDLLLLGAAALAVVACRPQRRLLDVTAGLGAFGLVAGALLDLDPSAPLGVGRALLGAALASLGAGMLTREVHRTRVVTLETLACAIASFLLFAVAWAELWGLLRWLQPWSLVVIHPAAGISGWEPSTLLQHSLMVLTTLDDPVIVATTPLSRTLTALQGLMGIVMLITLVARVVAVHALARVRPAQQPARPVGRRPVQLTLVRGDRDDGPESGGAEH